MFILLAIIVAIMALLIIVAGLLALLRNTHKRSNQAFFAVALSLGLWMIFNFIGSNTTVATLTPLSTRLDFMLAPLIILSVAYFIASFATSGWPAKFFNSRTVLSLNLFYAMLIVASSALGLVATSKIQAGDLNITHQSLYGAYVASIFVYVVVTAAMFVNIFRHATKRVRIELNLLLIGIFVALIANIISNIIVPGATEQRHIIQLFNVIGYLGLAVLTLTLYLSIATRKLFDIRFFVVRSLGYVITIIFASAVYGGVIIVLLNYVFDAGLSLGASILLLLGITLSGTLFQPTKKIFDRVSNRYFYRDAYSPQEVLARANRAAVSSIDIDTLLSKTGTIILDSIKPQYCVFDLSPTGYMKRRLVGDVHHIPDEKKVEEVEKLMAELKLDVVMLDEITDESPELYALMSDMRVSYIQRLMLSSESGPKKYGLVLLGGKKNGVPYSNQDNDTIRIVMGELSIALQNALQYEEIQRFNITLQEKVDDATKKMRNSNDKLRKLDETKDEFISMASHQLRTPLTSIKGYLSMVLEGDAGEISESQRKMLNQAFVSSQRMVYLISDLLNLSRLNTGKFVIDPTPVDLRDIVTAEIDQLRETAKSRDIKVEYDGPAEFPTIMLDETKIHQVVMNFMDNAIYYTTAGGTVTISLAETPTAVEFRVKDSGIGVPRSEQRHLFSKFYRAPNARKVRPDGTGLGLFMSKKVVAAQHGAIIFESEEGKGSTFGFKFNKATHALEPTPVEA